MLPFSDLSASDCALSSESLSAFPSQTLLRSVWGGFYYLQPAEMANEVKYWLSQLLDAYLCKVMSIKMVLVEASANLIWYPVLEIFWKLPQVSDSPNI